MESLEGEDSAMQSQSMIFTREKQTENVGLAAGPGPQPAFLLYSLETCSILCIVKILPDSLFVAARQLFVTCSFFMGKRRTTI